jgi:hypothetical protein
MIRLLKIENYCLVFVYNVEKTCKFKNIDIKDRHKTPKLKDRRQRSEEKSNFRNYSAPSNTIEHR